MRSVLLALALGLTACSAPAPGASGDLAQRVARLEDEREVARVAAALDHAVDAKDWRAARGFFADTINADFSSLGGEAGPVAADALVDAWRRGLHPNKTSLHLRGEEIVTVSGDTATMRSHGYALNALPQRTSNQYWEGWGTYEHQFTRTGDGWRINGLAFKLIEQRGDVGVRTEMLAPERPIRQ